MSILFFLTYTLLLTLFPKGIKCEYASDNRVFLKYKDSYCLYAKNIIENNKFEVASDECDKLVHGSEGKIIWMSSNNGRLKTQNGLCLKTYKNFLVVSTCSPELNEKSEMWKVDSEKRLKNENNSCAQISGNNLFSFTCNTLSTKEFSINVFSLDELNFMKVKYAHKKLQNVNKESLENSNTKSELLIHSYNEAEKKINEFLKKEKEMKKEKEKIINLMNNIKLLINTSSSLKNYGTGALMKIYDNIDINKKDNLLRVPLETLQVNEEKLNELGIENGQIKIIIQSFLNPPNDCNYTFVVKNVVGNFIIKLDNKEIISNIDMPNEKNLKSSLIHLSQNKLVPIYIEISSTNTQTNTPMPSFTLFWSSKYIPEQVIKSLYLYTTIYEKVCYTTFQKKINCSMTFGSIASENGEFQYLCPSECSEKDSQDRSQKNIPTEEIHSNDDVSSSIVEAFPCYQLNASICASAMKEQLLPQESGGVIKVMIKKRRNEKGIYEECGMILPTNMEDNTFKGITDIKLVDMDDFFLNYDTNRSLYEGYKGIVTDDKHSLLTKTDLSKRYISDIDINCNYNLRENYEFSSGAFIVKRIKSSDLKRKEQSIVVDAFALFEKYSNKDQKNSINIPGWTRKTCKDIQLYVNYKQPNDIMNYPSLLLSCDDTFEQINFDNNDVIVARCLPQCLHNEEKVLGSYIYAPQSPVCKSSIHSGIITNKGGGLIEIRKLQYITQSFTSTLTVTRNSVQATVSDHKNKDSYYITKPNGSICNFPRTSYNINESLNSDTNEDALFSFIQLKSYLKDTTPPVTLVHQKHAALKNQLYSMHNLYNTENYRKAFFLGKEENEGEPHITPTNVHTDLSPREQQMHVSLSAYHNGALPSSYQRNDSMNKNQNPELTDSFKTFQQMYDTEKEHLQKLAKKQESIFSNLILKNKQIHNLNETLSFLRNEQKHYESFIRTTKASTLSSINQFGLITSKKKFIIEKLEKSLANVKPIKVDMFEEKYSSTNVNDNYIIIDSKNMNGSSKWTIEKFTKGNLFASITNDNFIQSNEELYASYMLYKHTKLYKGFISSDINIPYDGNVGIIIKYKDHNNYSNFVINKNEFYFVEIIDGKRSKEVQKRQIKNLSHQLGAWVKLFVEFGYKNVRTYINGKYVSGFETKNDSYGFVGFGINNCKEKIFFDKVVIGSLDQAKYYKKTKKSIGILTTNGVNYFHQKEQKNPLNKNSLDEKKENISSPNECKIYTEMCMDPLETNWIIPLNSSWNILKNFNLSSIWKNNKAVEEAQNIHKYDANPIEKGNTNECYLHSIQKRNENGDLLIPSVILLKHQNLCPSMKSFTFKSSISLKTLTKSGIIFNVLSSQDFLSLILDISEIGGKIYLLKITNGIPYHLNAPTYIPITPDVWYNLKMSYNGTHIHITLNDEPLVTAKLNEYSSKLGNVGLMVLSGESKFKDISFVPQSTFENLRK